MKKIIIKEQFKQKIKRQFKIIFVLKLLILSVLFLTISQYNLIAEKQKNQKIIDEILADYEKLGAKNFSAKRGYELWVKEISAGKKKNCVECHNLDISTVGKHSSTGRKIEPMAAWKIPDRYTSIKKVEKWFKRNCKGTWGRECTPQEKGDFLEFLRAPYKSQN